MKSRNSNPVTPPSSDYLVLLKEVKERIHKKLAPLVREIASLKETL